MAHEYSLIDGKWHWCKHPMPPKCEHDTFKPLSSLFAIDANRAYRCDSVMRGVMPTDLMALNDHFAKTSDAVYCIEGIANKILQPRHFTALDPGFHLDSQGERLNWSFGSDGVNIYFSELMSGSPRILRGADPDTFTILDFGYAMDSLHVWHRGNPIKPADPKSFTPIDEIYSCDSRLVYRGCELIDSANPKTFVVINGHYAIDADTAFFEAKAIEDCDPKSLMQLGKFYAADSSRVYYFGCPLLGADPSSFELLGEGYARDENNVFYRGSRVPGADPKSFHTEGMFGVDSNFKFKNGEVVDVV